MASAQLNNTKSGATLDAYAAVPAALKAQRRWVLWKRETRNRSDKPTKVPYKFDGTKASSTDPTTWTTYNRVMVAVDGYTGIGFVLGDGVAGIDLDHCRNPETGVIEEWAHTVIETIGSYTEISPSGDGVHILVLADDLLPEDVVKRRGTVEFYQRDRYFTVTGNRVGDFELRRVSLQAIHAQLFPYAESEGRGTSADSRATPLDLRPSPSCPDDVVIAAARKATNGAETSRLLDGDYAGYDSPSEARFALVNRLAFYTQDHDQLVRLAEGAGFDRDGDERTLRKYDIPNALRQLRETWSGPGGRIGPVTRRDEATGDAGERSALPDFPTHLLPHSMRELVEAEAERLKLPAGMIATAALVTASAAIGGSRVVHTDDREHQASLWGVIVADSGVGKSPAIAVATRPYKDAAKLRARQYDMAWDDAEKWDKAGKDRGTTERPTIPALLLTTDTTTEALADDLSNAPRGMLIDVDELTAWANGMDAYRSHGAGTDRKRWLGMWNAAPITITRKRQRAINVERPIVALVGGMQPHAIAALNSEPDGLAVRMLYSYHVDFDEPYPTRAMPDQAVLGEWASTVGALLALHGIGEVLPMTAAARIAWYDGRDRRIDAARTHGQKMLYAKFDAMAARLALVLTLADRYDADCVDAHWVEVAWAILLDYYGPHGCMALSGSAPRIAIPGYEWLKQRDAAATRRDFVRYKVGGASTTERADKVIADLEAAGLVTVTQKVPARGGQPTITVELIR